MGMERKRFERYSGGGIVRALGGKGEEQRKQGRQSI